MRGDLVPGASETAHPISSCPPSRYFRDHVESSLADVEVKSRLGFSDDFLQPWLSKSTFRSLRQSLNRARLTWLQDLFSEQEESDRDWLAITIWHSSNNLVNNVFLTILMVHPVIDVTT